MPGPTPFLSHPLVLLCGGLLLAAPAAVHGAPEAVLPAGVTRAAEYATWRACRLGRWEPWRRGLPAALAVSPSPARPEELRRDAPFRPTEAPSREGAAVQQVVVTSEILAPGWREFAERETRRGIPTLVRTVDWIRERYPGADAPAAVRSFLRAAHDLWGTDDVLLGGDVEHVPARYIPWGEELLLTDLYYACLDREWNEDGDGVLGEPLPNGNRRQAVNGVAAGPEGVLWLATSAGIARLRAGEFTLFDEAQEGLPAEALCVDVASDGSVWAGTAAGVLRWEGDFWRSWGQGQGFPGGAVTCLLALSPSDVWAGTSGGLGHFDGTSWRFWSEADGLPASLITDLALQDGALWIGTLHGVARMEGEEIAVFDTSNSGLLSNWVLSIAVDASGTVWFGHADTYFARGGLSRFDGFLWSAEDFSGQERMGFAALAAGAEPEELWAATSRGLFHRRASRDTILATAQGLGSEELLSVSLLPSGELAVGGLGALAVGSPGSWALYGPSQGLPTVEANHDDIDLLPDLTLGRVPASDPAELASYLEKLLAYEEGTGLGDPLRALFLGEVLFEGGDGKAICRATAETFPPGMPRTELYEVDGTENAQAVRAELDRGPGYVVHVGHGSFDVMGVGAGMELLFNSDLDAVDSGGRFGFHASLNCNTAGFDQDCSLEHLLFAPRGGAIAAVGNTRAAIAGIDAEINRLFFQRLFASGHARPALALREVRTGLVNADPDRFRVAGEWRRMFLTRVYLGPPTLTLWRTEPREFRLRYPTLVPCARAPFPVTVEDAATGRPVEGALVCLSKGDEDYAYARTDARGRVAFDLRPESPGQLDVCVSAPEYLPHRGSASVEPPRGPHLSVVDWKRLAPPPGGGGPWRIVLGVRNAGTASEGGWDLELVSGDSRVVVLQGTGRLGALGEGQTGWTSPFLVHPVGGPEAGGGNGRIVLRGAGASAFAEEFLLPLAGAELRLEQLAVEGRKLNVRVRNVGDGATGALEAVLLSCEAAGSVIDARGGGAPLEPGVSALLSDGFEVAGDPSALYELRIADGRGGRASFTFDLLPPAGASAARAQPLEGGARLSWEASSAADLAGYRILGREGAGAGWTEELAGPLLQGAMAEVPLPPGGSREILILAVDRTGLESTDSCLVTAYAAPPTLPGWPQPLASMVGPSPVVASDLDGDGRLEILLGSLWEADAVHVFRADGTEWVDGDGDAGTRGIFARTGGRVLAAPTPVDVDGDGREEIFASSLDGSLHAWRSTSDGSPGVEVLAGWPVALSGPGSRSAPVAGDLDGDGDWEILVAASCGTVYAFHHDGAPVSGWPRETGRGDLGTAPAVFDLDGDGRDDVVFGGTDSLLYAVSGTGSDLPGWPVRLGAAVISSPVLADVDGDGDVEIFAIARDGRVWGLHHDDRDGVPGVDRLAGWPVSLGVGVAAIPSPAVADVDGDGLPEIVVGGDDELAVLRADGTPLPGWPVATASAATSSPVVADLDGDGLLDVLLATADRRLRAYDGRGEMLPRWPHLFRQVSRSTPCVADVDGDGDLDVVVASDELELRVLDVAGRARAGALPWPGYHGGSSQGVYAPEPHGAGQSVGGPEAAGPASLALLPAAPNPFRSGTKLRFLLPERSRVTLEVFNVAGRRVAVPVPGIVLPAGPHALFWDGRDAGGRALASGVYFLRLRTRERQLTGRLLRLR